MRSRGRCLLGWGHTGVWTCRPWTCHTSPSPCPMSNIQCHFRGWWLLGCGWGLWKHCSMALRLAIHCSQSGPLVTHLYSWVPAGGGTVSPEPGLKGKLCEVRHYDALTGLVLQKLAVFVFTEETVAFGALCSSLSHRHPLLSFLLQRKSGRGVCVCVCSA